ncbi:uncharacterized protein LOC132193926 [Neocloeon triangulifer]|uniref:uncharacterized protein LOC132193926 n=1 Tax=Neocloeon triangulifer TaxID=2078957 RepID=UPI00286F6EBF|nr:uncharacterized protein LOC132193926 [Neocloeon triangulifer]
MLKIEIATVFLLAFFIACSADATNTSTQTLDVENINNRKEKGETTATLKSIPESNSTTPSATLIQNFEIVTKKCNVTCPCNCTTTTKTKVAAEKSSSVHPWTIIWPVLLVTENVIILKICAIDKFFK